MNNAPTFHRGKKRITLDETKNPDVKKLLQFLNQLSIERPDLKMEIDETLLALSFSHMPNTQDALMFITLIIDYHCEISDLAATQPLINSLKAIYGESNMELYKEILRADIEAIHYAKKY